jgi:dihydroorotate dehydrogenase electron transfer subunit
VHIENARVEAHHDIQGGYRRLDMAAPAMAAAAQPGQFVHLRVPHMTEAVLRRPFSIFNAADGLVSVLYKAVGRGTRTLSFLQPGERVSLVGPLGRGYPSPDAGKRPVLVAGGYGMAALYLLARRQPVPGLAFFGGAAAADILCVKEFEALGWEVRVATEDGSLGRKGLVTDALDAWLAESGGNPAPEFFACGPTGMLRAVGQRAVQRGWTAWLSVDEKMGCGVGACLTCVVKVRADTPDGWAWARSCREGPVFECRELLWE